MYNWTDEQLAAIESFGSPTIVSAAAGSGKTAVLVERTIRLLCDEKMNIPADRLLAVTFTNDAASQMSQKLSQEIDARAEMFPDDMWIQRQQSLLRLAEITTINSFCYNLVKDNLSETDFHSGLRILEENEAEMLCDRALTAVLEREYSENSAEIEELISLFCRENDASLRNMVLKLYSFLRALPFRKNWIDGVMKSLRNKEAVKKLLDGIRKEVLELCDAISATADRLVYTAESLEYHSGAKAIFLENSALAENTVKIIRDAPPKEAASIAGNIVWKQLRARQTKLEKESASQIEDGIYQTAKDCQERLKEQFKELSEVADFSEEQVTDEAAEAADSLEKLYMLCEKLDAELNAMKVERNAVDFADTELICVSLLVNCDSEGNLTRTPLAEEIVRSERYRVILIDEFQDVNNLQEVIFRAVSDSDDLTEPGKNLFVVGDVKQSIYRFRQANPYIFMRMREMGKSPESSVRELLLRKNFRSRKSVLDFCNYVFSALMSKRLGETDYNEEESLINGSEFITPDCPTEIITVDSGEDSDFSELEFTAVSRRIRQLIDSGAEVVDGGVSRPCRPSDFCVLTRNNVTGSKLSEIFGKEGLKVLASDTSGYLRSREISLLLNLLAVISNPMQDVPLASVMLSPIMGFSDDDAAKLRIFSRDDKLYKIMLAVSQGSYSASEELKKKCTDGVELLKKLSVLASGLTLTRLIRKIYDVTDIFVAASAYEDGEQKCANLYLLLEYARSYEKSSAEGVSGFLRYIDYISKSGGDFEQALTVTETSEAVTVKTVHRSKGLEYPFVFICQTGKRFNKTDLNGQMLLNTEAGVGFSYYDYNTLTKRRTAFWKQVRSANASELLSEELRLLYVALTRAKERLFIVLDIGEKQVSRIKRLSYEMPYGQIPASLASRAECTADWLMLAMMKHPDFVALRSKLGGGLYTDSACESPPIRVIPMPQSESIEEKPEAKDVRPDSGLVKALRESFAISLNTRLTENEAKLTVSEIVKDDALSFFPKVPSLDESLEELSAAQIGTLTHKFMQFCRFEEAETDLEAEISRLKESSVFTEKEAESIDRKGVRGFFESSVYGRLKKSGKVLRERRFIVKFDDIDVDESLKKIYSGTDGMLQGIADCLFEEDDGYVLVDYKTDKVSSAIQLAEKYSGQLSLYKAAFNVLLDKPIKSSYIYSFRLGEGIEIKE